MPKPSAAKLAVCRHLVESNTQDLRTATRHVEWSYMLPRLASGMTSPVKGRYVDVFDVKLFEL